MGQKWQRGRGAPRRIAGPHVPPLSLVARGGRGGRQVVAPVSQSARAKSRKKRRTWGGVCLPPLPRRAAPPPGAQAPEGGGGLSCSPSPINPEPLRVSARTGRPPPPYRDAHWTCTGTPHLGQY